MTTRCKFQLTEIRTNCYNSKIFIFETRYDTSIPEDQRFYKATPNGKFEMMVDNPIVIENFKLGNYYYFDVTDAG